MVNIIQPSTFCARTDRHIEVIRFSKGKAMHVCLSACLPVWSGSTESSVKTTTYQCNTQHAKDLKKNNNCTATKKEVESEAMKKKKLDAIRKRTTL